MSTIKMYTRLRQEHSPFVKKKIVEMYKSGKTILQIAAEYQIAKTTIRSWVLYDRNKK